MICIEYQRQKTKPKDIAYSLFLYFLDRLSYRNATKALYGIADRSYLVSIWKWVQKYKSQKILNKRRKKVEEFIIDETQTKVGSQYVWLWVDIEPKHRQILQMYISFEITMLIVSERFIIASLIDTFGKHSVSTSDGGTWYPSL